MIAPSPIARRKTEVANAYGLHLRPAGRFVELAQGFAAEIRVLCNGTVANGKSVLDVIGLGAVDGTELVLEACGPDAEQAVAALAELVATRFPMN